MELIQEFEHFIVGSQNPIQKIEYSRLNLRIERISGIFHFLMIRLTTAGVVLPSLIIAVVNYFIFDLAEDLFYLPCPLM